MYFFCDDSQVKHKDMLSLCSQEQFWAIFFAIVVFASAIGMLTMSVITMDEEVSDRCVAQAVTGRPNVFRLKKLSFDAVVTGGFGVAGAAAAFGLALTICCCEGFKQKNAAFYFVLSVLAGVAFAVLAGLTLHRADKPQERCGFAPDADGRYKIPDLEIATATISALILVGTTVPAVQKFLYGKK